MLCSVPLVTACLLMSSPSWQSVDATHGRLLFDGEPFLDAAVSLDGAAPCTLAWEDCTLVLGARLPGKGTGTGAHLTIKTHLGELRHIWVPHLAPTPDHVMGDHAFRSPAIVLANRRIAIALVPDLDDVARQYTAGVRTWLDYDHPNSTVTLAAGSYKVSGHVLYKRADLSYAGQSIKLRMHVVTSTAAQDLENPYGLAARWLWNRWGRPRHQVGGSQRASIDTYAKYIARWAFSPEGWGETVWQEFAINGRPCGAPAFIVDVQQHPSVPLEKRRWREQRSVWNQAWFSTQRCANGLWRYAQLTGMKELAKRARLSTNLALSAPQTDGLFPAVYTTAPPGKPKWYQLYKDTAGWDKGRWSNSDRRPPGVSQRACHILDAAFTARLLLEWHDLVGGDAEIRTYVERFAGRLVRLARPSGAFPGWVEPDGTVPAALAEGPESAMGASLLLELCRHFPASANVPAWRKATAAALEYLAAGPVAQGRWEDYETYFSCCRWGTIGRRVERQGVFKQNTLSPFWCAEAFLQAYRLFGNERYLQLGRRCLDELSLFQQVWDPPFIPAPCHGGFGVMNADGEWNDARQSLFAPIFLAYYRETGHADYFERGVAALRASFAMLYCPENEQVRRQYELRHPFFGPESYGFMMENIAHGGPAPPNGRSIGPFTIYTWGNGAALATAATVRDSYGDVYVDSARRRAFGIDGCTAEVTGTSVRVTDKFKRPSVTAVYASGTRRTVRLVNGQGELSLVPDLRYWLENALAYHTFTYEEAAAATGLSVEAVKREAAGFGIKRGKAPARKAGAPLRVLPYPGGRHPRIGFLDGAVDPVRGTKATVFLPWEKAGYVVLDLPEALWTNLGLTYLAHTHIPTIWDKQNVKLPHVEWQRLADGVLANQLRLPNGITIAGRIVPRADAVDLKLSIRNGTPAALSNIRAQICLMLKGAPAFEEQTGDNKRQIGQCHACMSRDGKRWIVIAWERGKTWENPDVPCMHSDPNYPDAAAGTTVTDRGRIFFYQGKDVETEIKRRRAAGTLFGED